MPIVTQSMKDAAIEEIRNPTMAFDKVMPNGEHAYQWILDTPVTPDFFANLASRCIDEIRNPSGKLDVNSDSYREVARILRDDIVMRPNRHPMLLAGDQNYSNSMPVRGGRYYDQSTASSMPQYDQDDPDDANGNLIDVDAAMMLVEKLVAGLQGEEKDKFLEALANYFQTAGAQDGHIAAHPGNGNGNNGIRDNNRGSLDSRRSGRRGARDSRRPAQDSAVAALNQASFARRFPYAMSIKFGGMGR